MSPNALHLPSNGIEENPGKKSQADFRALVKIEYEKILEEGNLSANKAAAEALRRAKAKMGN